MNEKEIEASARQLADTFAEGEVADQLYESIMSLVRRATAKEKSGDDSQG